MSKTPGVPEYGTMHQDPDGRFWVCDTCGHKSFARGSMVTHIDLKHSPKKMYSKPIGPKLEDVLDEGSRKTVRKRRRREGAL